MNGGPVGPDFLDPKPAINNSLASGQRKSISRTDHTAGLLGVPFKFRKCGQSGLDVSELLPPVGPR